MNIRTRLQLLIATTAVAFTAIIIANLAWQRQADRLNEKEKLVRELHFALFERAQVRDEYFMHGEERAKIQWLSLNNKMLLLLEDMASTFLEPDEKELVRGIAGFNKRTGVLFGQLVAQDERVTGPDSIGGALRERLVSQMMATSHSLYLEGLKLQRLVSAKGERQHELLHLYGNIAYGSLAALIIALAVLLIHSITVPLVRLQKGTKIVAEGHLEHQTGIRTRDEIGQLSAAFDLMTERLRAITVSREELSREIAFSQAVIDSLPGLFYLFDERGTFLRWNKNFEKISGYPPEDIARMSPLDFFEGRSKVAIAEKIRQVFLTGEAYLEADLLSKDRSSTPFLFTGMLLNYERKPCLIGTGIDISDRKRAEGALKRYAEDLARSNKELEQFAYIASHDLLEPVRMISSYVQLLKKRYRGRLDADADDFIDYTVDGAERMQRMIHDILQYSRVGTRGNPFEPVDCNRVLDDSVSNMKLVIEDSQALITLPEGPLPLLVADGPQLTQVFQNLIANAIKFRGDRRPEIRIGAERKGDEWIFAVRDNGIGFETQYAEKIFDIFKRLHSAARYPGSGIGLSICRRIVERHGGRIWAESEPGKGSVFYFALPAKRQT